MENSVLFGCIVWVLTAVGMVTVYKQLRLLLAAASKNPDLIRGLANTGTPEPEPPAPATSATTPAAKNPLG